MALSEKEYNNVAKPKHLHLIGYAPPNVYTVAIWECDLCGRIHHKTYRAVKYGARGCICQSSRVNPLLRYRLLAASIGLVFIGTVACDEHGDNKLSQHTPTSLSERRDKLLSTENVSRLLSERTTVGQFSDTPEMAGDGRRFGDDERVKEICEAVTTSKRASERGSSLSTNLSYEGEYISGGIPKTTKERVVWAKAENLDYKFLASFQQLSYGNGKKLKKKLGLKDE